MGETLAQVVVTTEAQSRDATEEHLYPSSDGDGFTHDAVAGDDPSSDLAVDTALEVQLEVYAHGRLGKHHQHEPWSVGGVHVCAELTAAVGVAEEVA